MRNSKTKGFTLIELIVVIAIIGILAAILVPSMLGYVRNARISQANANAKQVHTAVSSALTQLGISNVNLLADYDGANFYVDIKPAASGKIEVAFTGTATGNQPSTEKMDLVSYLGENFTGTGRAYFNPSTYSVNVALYAAASSATDVGASNKAIAAGAACIKAGTGKTTVNELGELKQKELAKAGTLVGVYPQGTDAAAPASTTK